MITDDTEYLRAELKRVNLSQCALARLLEAHIRTVCRWAAGDLPLPYYVRLVLAAIPTPGEQ